MNFLWMQNWWMEKKAQVYTALIRNSAGKIGKNSIIRPPLHSYNLEQLQLGENCLINSYGWIQCIKSYAGVEHDPKLEIGDNTSIGHFTHIIACSHLKIGKNVMIADRVYISDNLHGFENVNMPVSSQPLKLPGPVTIEDEVWIGDGVSILPNVTIGRHSIIGSNSVVTKDIPPYCVAAGIPAKVIRKYNSETNSWERVR
ncbi:MAG: putative acetyltransferase [Smithella sp. PtaU1.Bin162]|nr:MAG: putative acetyltransferase [Smithella sp. PtaU1.Bin162]